MAMMKMMDWIFVFTLDEPKAVHFVVVDSELACIMLLKSSLLYIYKKRNLMRAK